MTSATPSPPSSGRREGWGDLGLSAFGAIPLFGDVAKGVKGVDSVADVARGVDRARDSTKEVIQREVPKTSDGDFIDPNTGQVIPGEGPFDYGHKPGFEWWRTQQRARSEGRTREQVIEYENDPLALPDRGSERESKPPLRGATMSDAPLPTEVDRDGRSELHQAALADDDARVAELVDAGCALTLHDVTGLTPLHLAAQEHATAAARRLLDAGAEVDAVDEHGNTPLFTAVFNSRGRPEMIALLRERGADPLVENRHGQSPLGLARLIGNFDVEQHFSDLS